MSLAGGGANEKPDCESTSLIPPPDKEQGGEWISDKAHPGAVIKSRCLPFFSSLLTLTNTAPRAPSLS